MYLFSLKTEHKGCQQGPRDQSLKGMIMNLKKLSNCISACSAADNPELPMVGEISVIYPAILNPLNMVSANTPLKIVV